MKKIFLISFIIVVGIFAYNLINNYFNNEKIQDEETTRNTKKVVSTVGDALKEGQIMAINNDIKRILSDAWKALDSYKSKTGTFADSDFPEKCNQQIVQPFVDEIISRRSIPLSEIGCDVSSDGRLFTFYSGLTDTEDVACGDSKSYPSFVEYVYDVGVSCGPYEPKSL